MDRCSVVLVWALKGELSFTVVAALSSLRITVHRNIFTNIIYMGFVTAAYTVSHKLVLCTYTVRPQKKTDICESGYDYVLPPHLACVMPVPGKIFQTSYNLVTNKAVSQTALT